MMLPPEGPPEELPELTQPEATRLLNDVMDALHRARLFPLETEVVLICSHRFDSGQKVELMFTANDADRMRTKGVLMSFLENM